MTPQVAAQGSTAVVAPTPDSRLEALAAQYDLAKAEADKAAAALKSIVDGIKLELTQAAPGAESIELATDLLTRPLRLVAVESWRIDTARLKKEDPEIYVRWAKKSTSWSLKSVTS